MPQNFLSLHTAVVESQDIPKLFGQTPGKIKVALGLQKTDTIEQILLLGSRDYCLLIRTDLLTQPDAATGGIRHIQRLEHYGPELTGIDWTSQLLIHLADGKLPNDGKPVDTDSAPLVFVVFVKLKDVAFLDHWGRGGLRAHVGTPAVDAVKKTLIKNFADCIDRGAKSYYGRKGVPAADLRWELYYSYSGAADFAFVFYSASAFLVSEVVAAIHRLRSDDNPRFEHCVHDTHTLMGVNIGTAGEDAGFDLCDALVKKAAAMPDDGTRARLSIKPRTGHAGAAVKALGTLGHRGNFAAGDVRQNMIELNDDFAVSASVATLAKLLQSPDLLEHIKQTTSELRAPIGEPRDKNLKVDHEPTLPVEEIEAPHAHLSRALQLSPSTSHALKLASATVIRLGRDSTYQNLFSYLHLSINNLYLLLHGLSADKKHRQQKRLAVIDQRILGWLEQLDLCFRSRYRGAGLSLDISNLPVVSYQGSYQKTLMVCDLLTNVFLAILLADKEVYGFLQSLRPKDYESMAQEFLPRPVVISHFGRADVPYVKHYRDLETCFLDIGWKSTFLPLTISTLAHESANAFLGAFLNDEAARASRYTFKDVGHWRPGDMDTIFMDAIADWIALCLLAVDNPNDACIESYYRRIADLSDVFQSDGAVSRFTAIALMRFAWRYHFVSRMVQARPNSPLHLLENLIQTKTPFELVSGFLNTIGYQKLQAHIATSRNQFVADIDAIPFRRDGGKLVQWQIMGDSAIWNRVIAMVWGVATRSRGVGPLEDRYVGDLVRSLREHNATPGSNPNVADAMVDAAMTAQLVSPHDLFSLCHIPDAMWANIPHWWNITLPEK